MLNLFPGLFCSFRLVTFWLCLSFLLISLLFCWHCRLRCHSTWAMETLCFIVFKLKLTITGAHGNTYRTISPTMAAIFGVPACYWSARTPNNLS
jgi:hypothetical protein